MIFFGCEFKVFMGVLSLLSIWNVLAMSNQWQSDKQQHGALLVYLRHHIYKINYYKIKLIMNLNIILLLIMMITVS
jgi:hypothetical protein